MAKKSKTRIIGKPKPAPKLKAKGKANSFGIPFEKGKKNLLDKHPTRL